MKAGRRARHQPSKQHANPLSKLSFRASPKNVGAAQNLKQGIIKDPPQKDRTPSLPPRRLRSAKLRTIQRSCVSGESFLTRTMFVVSQDRKARKLEERPGKFSRNCSRKQRPGNSARERREGYESTVRTSTCSASFLRRNLQTLFLRHITLEAVPASTAQRPPRRVVPLLLLACISHFALNAHKKLVCHS